VAVTAGIFFTACSPSQPKIEFTKVPAADKGGPDVMDTIAGRVSGAKPGQRIVVFARSDVWWVEPRLGRVFTQIRNDSTWETQTHFGTEYAAALVDPGYEPAVTSQTLPAQGGNVAVLAIVQGTNASAPVHRTIQFSGYEWTVRSAPSERGGLNEYSLSNVWTDDKGALHLRIAGDSRKWTCAQLILNRSLGYGTYRVVVRDVSGLDPAAVFAIYTLSDVGAASTNRNPREWDIELSRWGDPAGKNARFLVQPSYADQNTVWFTAPAGLLTYEARWENGKVRLTTASGVGGKTQVADHLFTSDAPVAGDERFRINLYDYQRGPQLLKQGTEVVVERFEYFP